MKFALPDAQEGGQGTRGARSATTSRAPSARGRRPRTSARSTRRSSATPRPRRTAIIEEARQAAEQVRQDLIAKAEADAAEIRPGRQDDIRLAHASGRWPTFGHRSRTCRSSSPRRSSSATSIVDTQIALIESYINVRRELAGDDRRERARIEAYAQAMLEVARVERPPRRGRGRPVPLRPDVRGLRRPAARAHRPAAARRAADRGHRRPDGREGARRRAPRSSSMVVAAGQAGDLPAIVERFVELAAAERSREVAEVRTRDPARRDADRSASPRRWEARRARTSR